MLNRGKSQIFQSKVDCYRVVHLPDYGVPWLQALKQEMNHVFKDDEAILYPYIKTSPNKWDTLINNALKPFTIGLNIKSHSFRIGYVTQILRHSSVDRAQAFVGHKDIRSTMRYNTYFHGTEEDLKILNRAFTPSDE